MLSSYVVNENGVVGCPQCGHVECNCVEVEVGSTPMREGPLYQLVDDRGVIATSDDYDTLAWLAWDGTHIVRA